MNDRVLAVWENRFAPITFEIGFLKAPVDAVVDALVTWRRSLDHGCAVQKIPRGLPDSFALLEPLVVGGLNKELVVQTASRHWTAYFCDGYRGGDVQPGVSVLSERLGVLGVRVVSIPWSTSQLASPSHLGARGIDLMHESGQWGCVRSLCLGEDGAVLTFDEVGEVQGFEEPSAYRRRRRIDRFTAGMLENYCSALGIRPWSEDFYPGPSVLVRNESSHVGTMSLDAAQRFRFA